MDSMYLKIISEISKKTMSLEEALEALKSHQGPTHPADAKLIADIEEILSSPKSAGSFDQLKGLQTDIKTTGTKSTTETDYWGMWNRREEREVRKEYPGTRVNYEDNSED